LTKRYSKNSYKNLY